MKNTNFFFVYRETRSEGATPRRTAADEDNRLPARAHAGRRRINRRWRTAFQPRVGRAARTTLALRAGPAAHLLPEARGPGARAATHREHVPLQPAFLTAPRPTPEDHSRLRNPFNFLLS